MGTSLTVHPFASLTQLVPESCPRVLINMDQAGDIGSRADDVLLLGKTDEVVRQLCEALGDDWVEELDAMWKETEKYVPKSEEKGGAEAKETKTADEDKIAQAEALQDEVEQLTNRVERALQLGHVPSAEDDEKKPSAAEVEAIPEISPPKNADIAPKEALPVSEEVKADMTSADAKTENRPEDKTDSEKSVEGKL